MSHVAQLCPADRAVRLFGSRRHCVMCGTRLRCDNRSGMCTRCQRRRTDHNLYRGTQHTPAEFVRVIKLLRTITDKERLMEADLEKCRGGCGRPGGGDNYCPTCRAKEILRLERELRNHATGRNPSLYDG